MIDSSLVSRLRAGRLYLDHLALIERAHEILTRAAAKSGRRMQWSNDNGEA